MTDTDTGGPAFPIKGPVMTSDEQGMTLRDYFAAKALVAGINDSQLAPMYSFEDHADRAYKMADAMLSARGTEKERNT